MRKLFEFPNPVNEVSARLVAGGVVALTLVILLAHQPWLIAVLAYGFWARVLTAVMMKMTTRMYTNHVYCRALRPKRPSTDE